MSIELFSSKLSYNQQQIQKTKLLYVIMCKGMPNYMTPSFDNHALFDIVMNRMFEFHATVPSIEGFTACQ